MRVAFPSGATKLQVKILGACMLGIGNPALFLVQMTGPVPDLSGLRVVKPWAPGTRDVSPYDYVSIKKKDLRPRRVELKVLIQWAFTFCFIVGLPTSLERIVVKGGDVVRHVDVARQMRTTLVRRKCDRRAELGGGESDVSAMEGKVRERTSLGYALLIWTASGRIRCTDHHNSV